MRQPRLPSRLSAPMRILKELEVWVRYARVGREQRKDARDGIGVNMFLTWTHEQEAPSMQGAGSRPAKSHRNIRAR
eukprot:4736351-Lingulodinium_polyedra.AAC.1